MTSDNLEISSINFDESMSSDKPTFINFVTRKGI